MTKKIVVAEETNVIVRTPEVIAIEIRSIDTQTREFVLRSAIEIGKRLTEAKALVAHGEWGKWLEANVSYKQSTANNFMRISEEYANSQALANLSYTQAIALLAIPADEREAFAEENNVEDMSSRELQAAIKERQELERQLQEEKERVRAEQVARGEEQAQREALHAQYQQELLLRQKIQADLNAAQAEAAKADADKSDAKSKVELRKAEKALSESQQRLAETQQKIEQSETELEAKIAERVKQREQELAEKAKIAEAGAAKKLAEMQEQLRKNNNVAAIKVKVVFESLVGNFKDLLAAVAELENEEQKQAIQGRIAKLCDEMKGAV